MFSTTAYRRRRLLVSAVVVSFLGSAALASTGSAVAAPATGASPTATGVHYAVTKPVCAQPTDPSANRCFALRRVAVPKSTPGAVAYTALPGRVAGPAGGYTPTDLATAYGFNPAVNRSSTTVATVLWNDDPNALADLNTFDAHYHSLDPSFPAAETATSFAKVSQTGTTAYPVADADAAGEESLDIETIRSVCHSCKILLVEATTASDADLAVAETYAASHATVVSNSWGVEEKYTASAALVKAFNHPGVAITASTGDSGWYDWDYANYQNPPDTPGVSANYPATDSHVIAVSGTTLQLSSAGKRTAETVWNNDGREDAGAATAIGVAGGGCSKTYAAAAWQSHYAGFPAACKGKRLATDVSALADPVTGFDVYDSYGTAAGKQWGTFGGTSLSSPLVAAMIALAGGPQGVAYPATTIYANALHHPTSRFDVTSGGTGFCDGDTVAACTARTKQVTTHPNPNYYFGARVDCDWLTTSAAETGTFDRECNAASGYDGASGVGTPNGLGLFTPYHPTVSIGESAKKTATTFTAKVTEPVTGLTASAFAWTFGDGKKASAATAPVKHTYAKAGTYTVTVRITDSQRLTATKAVRVTVGRAPSVSFHGAASTTHSRSTAYNATGSHSINTGGKVSKVSWNWGDKHTSTGTSVHHTWTKKGKYTVTLTITDTTGVAASARRTVTVR